MTPHSGTTYGVDWFRDLVVERWNEWGLDGQPGRVHVLQVSGGNWHVGQRRVTWLAFNGSGPDPHVVCKCSLGGPSPTLAHEHESLVALGSGGAAVSFRVAAPLQFVDGAGVTFLVQRALSGAPLHAPPTRARFRSDEAAAVRGFDLVAGICEDLMNRTRPGAVDDAEAHPSVRRLLDRVDKLRAKYHYETIDSAALAAAVAEMRIPTSWSAHGDLTGDHVRLDGDTCAVIDWERYTDEGLPFTDLMHYAMTLNQYLRGCAPELFAGVFLATDGVGNGPVAAAARSAAERVADRVPVEPNVRADWMALALLDVVVSWKWSAFEGGARNPKCEPLIQQALGRLYRSRRAANPA